MRPLPTNSVFWIWHNCIWWWVYATLLPLLPGPLWPGIVVLVWVPLLDQINLFKDYLYLIRNLSEVIVYQLISFLRSIFWAYSFHTLLSDNFIYSSFSTSLDLEKSYDMLWLYVIFKDHGLQGRLSIFYKTFPRRLDLLNMNKQYALQSQNHKKLEDLMVAFYLWSYLWLRFIK